MSSIATKINDDYATYLAFCKTVNEAPVAIREQFYIHQTQLMQKHGYVQDGCWFKKENN